MTISAKQSSKYAFPTCDPIRVEYFSSAEEMNIRYNELLFDETIHSFLPLPIKNKKGYWKIEIEKYSDKWLKKYGNIKPKN